MRPRYLLPVAVATAAARSLTWPGTDDSSPAPLSRSPHAYTNAVSDTNLSKSIYDIISESERGRRFTELLESHHGLQNRLSDDGQSLTVFVPVDDAFRRLNGLMRSDEEVSIREVLEYHVLGGRYSLDDLAGARTLSTMLEEQDLDRQAQRIHVGVGASGVEINFYSRVIGSDSIVGANGVVHFLDDVLIPPPRHDRLIAASPSLGTFSKALRISGASEEVRDHLGGVTVFAPTDEAWAALGLDVNAFLFSEEGRVYLNALVRYHILIGEVVYTDDMEDEEGLFPTMLAGASVSVDMGPLKRLRDDEGMEGVRDVPARDGVVHVVDEVLFPSGGDDGGVPGVPGVPGGVEEVRRRLGRFVDGFESFEL
ncbi:fasciclin domain family [Colletotrichum plurivorum]|uniref:Fasciclin domain family n=1 Tax=Colletotrichum plurivorum TaxID=2175906 RepID=A0A8H6K0F0_9PEZI|nr:fasciclin domain family [Colletotrichum plurivorum]